jgi:GTP-binding protein LepA
VADQVGLSPRPGHDCAAAPVRRYLEAPKPGFTRRFPISSFADQTFTAPAQMRNFCLMSHIDHGKSTLADRMFQLMGVVDVRSMQAEISTS